jgi:CspA family cold shock protein
MATGTVKWYNPAKRYGFITPDEGRDDVFVHVTAVQAAGLDSLMTGQRISYELKAGPNGRPGAGELKIVAA